MNRIKNRYIYITLIFFLILGCNKNKDLYIIVENKYLSCKEEPCIIDFDKELGYLIKEDWDKIYIIEGDYPMEIDSYKGSDNLNFSESIPKILFVKGRNIVYQEGFLPNIGKKREGLLIDYNLNPYTVVSRENAKFLIFEMDKTNIHYTNKALYIKLVDGWINQIPNINEK